MRFHPPTARSAGKRLRFPDYAAPHNTPAMRRLLRTHLAIFDAALRCGAAIEPLSPQQEHEVLHPALASLLASPAAVRRICPASDDTLSAFLSDISVLAFRFPPSVRGEPPPPPLLALPSHDGRVAYLAAGALQPGGGPAAAARACLALECALAENLARWRARSPRLIVPEQRPGPPPAGATAGSAGSGPLPVQLSAGDLYAALAHGRRPPPASPFRLAVDSAALGAPP